MSEACHLSLNNDVQFIRHVRVTHSGLNIFRCLELNCEKTFQLLDSFIRHGRSKHPDKVQIPSSFIENPSCSLLKRLENLSERDEQASFHVSRENSSVSAEDSSDSSDYDALSEEDLLWNDENSQCLSNVFETLPENLSNEASIQFAGKLYHYLDLPRNRVNSIIKEASDLFENTLSSL